MIGRLGFACKYLHPDQSQKKKVLEELQRPLTEKCTTITWLNRQTREEAEQRLQKGTRETTLIRRRLFAKTYELLCVGDKGAIL